MGAQGVFWKGVFKEECFAVRRAIGGVIRGAAVELPGIFAVIVNESLKSIA